MTVNAFKTSVLAASALAIAACGSAPHNVPVAEAASLAGDVYALRDTTIAATLSATGVARPYAQATLSTKLMGSVTAVLVREGERVAAGQALVRIDARDLDAKREQVSASIASAEAVRGEAALQAQRWRALYADSAAPRAQVDAAEAALARANAGVETASAAQAELTALGDYATIRAPFAGVVTGRLVDPGAFAAPGTPLISLQDDSRLRVTAAVQPSDAARLRRGMVLDATIEGVAATATVEGVFPGDHGGELFSVNALVPNRGSALPSGGAAVLSLRLGMRGAILVPTNAIRREGSLTGVMVVQNGKESLRWVRLAPANNDMVEVLAGLRAGDSIRVPRGESR